MTEKITRRDFIIKGAAAIGAATMEATVFRRAEASTPPPVGFTTREMIIKEAETLGVPFQVREIREVETVVEGEKIIGRKVVGVRFLVLFGDNTPQKLKLTIIPTLDDSYGVVSKANQVAAYLKNAKVVGVSETRQSVESLSGYTSCKPSVYSPKMITKTPSDIDLFLSPPNGGFPVGEAMQSFSFGVDMGPNGTLSSPFRGITYVYTHKGSVTQPPEWHYDFNRESWLLVHTELNRLIIPPNTLWWVGGYGGFRTGNWNRPNSHVFTTTMGVYLFDVSNPSTAFGAQPPPRLEIPVGVHSANLPMIRQN